MKKVIVALVVMLGMTLTSCSWFDSEPIEPNIIGSGKLQHEAKGGTWFVVVDSIPYTVINVTIPDHNPRTIGKTQNIEPVEGMLVTVFTSLRKTGVQAVTGLQSVEQIEELYHTNSTTGVILFGLLFLCVLGLVLPRRTKKGSKSKVGVLLLLMCVVLFLGCTDRESWYEDRIRPIRIEGVQPIKFYQIDVIGIAGEVLVDSVTRNEYILTGFGAYGAGLTPRLDSIGKPIRYTGKFPE